MKCDEVQALHNPYLDSELDAKTTFEIQRHLKSCPDCARLFAEARHLDTRIASALNQGPRTAALWEQIERSVVSAASSTASHEPFLRRGEPAGWLALLVALAEPLRAGWARSPRAWTGLAAVWTVVFALHFSARQTDTPLAARPGAPSATEMRFAMKQKELLMAELAGASEPVPADKPKPVPTSPRSDRRNSTLNS
jgi:anti-sigma factor RsiW